MDTRYTELVSNIRKAEDLQTLSFLHIEMIKVSNHNTEIFVKLHAEYRKQKKKICNKKKNKYIVPTT